MNTVLVNIDRIDPNPWQTRKVEDVEHVRKVADSISSQGLMQAPVCRLVGANGPVSEQEIKAFNWNEWNLGETIQKSPALRVQLAFGHTRLAAFKLLGWDVMPVIIRAMTDEEMFALGVGENIARKDLTPIEEAQAMKCYRDEFKKTSAEIGKLFSLSESAVRNKMRLVELPAEAQAALAGGQISEGNARMLLSLAKIQPDQVANIVGQISGADLTPEAVARKIEYAIDKKKAFVMWGRYNSGTPAGGVGLFPLTWVADKISLNWSEFQKACPQDMPKVIHGDGLKTLFEGATYWIIQGNYDLKRLIETGTPPEVGNLVWKLMFPPACTACEHHVSIDGNHYCGFKACWIRKKEAWKKAELQHLVDEWGIPAYSETQDGKYYEVAGQTYYRDNKVIDTEETYRTWLETKDKYLRLCLDYSEYRPWKLTDSHVVQLISVHPTIVKRLMAEEDEKVSQEVERTNQRVNLQRDDDNRNRSSSYIDKEAIWLFVYPFKKLPLPVLRDLFRSYRTGGCDDLTHDQLCQRIARIVINPGWDVLARGPLAVAEHLKTQAVTWGLPEPLGSWDEWIDRARKYVRDEQPVHVQEIITV